MPTEQQQDFPLRDAKNKSFEFDLTGGLDFVNPEQSKHPGTLIDCVNFEPHYRLTGYRRIKGYAQVTPWGVLTPDLLQKLVVFRLPSSTTLSQEERDVLTAPWSNVTTDTLIPVLDCGELGTVPIQIVKAADDKIACIAEPGSKLGDHAMQTIKIQTDANGEVRTLADLPNLNFRALPNRDNPAPEETADNREAAEFIADIEPSALSFNANIVDGFVDVNNNFVGLTGALQAEARYFFRNDGTTSSLSTTPSSLTFGAYFNRLGMVDVWVQTFQNVPNTELPSVGDEITLPFETMFTGSDGVLEYATYRVMATVVSGPGTNTTQLDETSNGHFLLGRLRSADEPSSTPGSTNIMGRTGGFITLAGAQETLATFTGGVSSERWRGHVAYSNISTKVAYGFFPALNNGHVTFIVSGNSSVVYAHVTHTSTVRAQIYDEAVNEYMLPIVTEVPEDGDLAVLEEFSPSVNVSALEVHEDRLFVGTRGGILKASVVGDPLNFSGVYGALAFNLEAAILDIASVSGGLLVITTTLGVWGLYTSGSSYELRKLSNRVGTVANTTQEIDTLISLDHYGLTSLARTEQYGDYRASSVSDLVQPWIVRNRDRIIGSALIRDSSQYRLYLTDGRVLVATLSLDNPEGQGNIVFTLLNYDIEIERVIYGHFANDQVYFLSGGVVYKTEEGNMFDGRPIPARIQTAYGHYDSPQIYKLFKRALLEYRSDSSVNLMVKHYVDFGERGGQKSILSREIGDFGHFNYDDWDESRYAGSNLAERRVPINGSGHNLSFLFISNASNQEPFVLESLSVQYEPKRWCTY